MVFRRAHEIVVRHPGGHHARALVDLDRDGRPEVFFGGPIWRDGFVDRAIPFSLVEIRQNLRLKDISDKLPANLKAVHAREAVTGDFDGDGTLDVFIAATGFDRSPFAGEANELLFGRSLARAGDIPRLKAFSHSASVGDLNGDGRDDVFVSNFGDLGESSPGRYFLFANRKGELSRKKLGLEPAPGLTTTSLLVDVDGDGDLDAVEATHDQAGPGAAGWVLMNRNGRFDGAPRFLPEGAFGRSIAADIVEMDVNGDGRPDLLMSQTGMDPFYEDFAVQLLINRKGRRFVDRTDAYFSDPDGGPSWLEFLHLADLNGDGRQDVIGSLSGGEGQTAVAWMAGRGGAFYRVDDDLLALPHRSWVPADYDGDGKTDFVGFSSADDRNETFESVSLYLNASRGKGMWKAEGFARAETFRGSGHGDRFNAMAGDDKVRGNGGKDQLTGAGGDDLLVGGRGADRLSGGRGADRLKGGAGPDLLDGGPGKDRLVGGGGDDVFRFSAGDRRDVIVDFRDGADQLRFDGGASSFSALTLRRKGDDVVVSYGRPGDAVKIKDVERADIGPEDFLFG